MNLPDHATRVRCRPGAAWLAMPFGAVARAAVAEGTTCAGPVLSDLLAATLTQMGYAVEPPRDPRAVVALLATTGLLPHEEGLYARGDLEDWQPYLVVVRPATIGSRL